MILTSALIMLNALRMRKNAGRAMDIPRVTAIVLRVAKTRFGVKMKFILLKLI